ncbi:hypothetical protein [Marinactinospora rubrisoli]|uniref:CDP-Glycerol:Poly(Glycerophosphate) glycerophosphotransferase n=1 Tax=Marinactinospora rubrisoli TaxID=2715399 RepID=A0ABW2KJ65_9ACTN
MDWIEVPIGIDADRWVTRRGCRTVLVLVHTVACGQRLLDVVALLRRDLRVQLVFAAAPSAFSAGVAEFLSNLGGAVLPWEQATRTRFDLIVAASTGGIEHMHAPVVLLPHGAGFTKFVSAARTGSRDGRRETYSLGRQWLVRDGRVLPAALVLAHEEERSRLSRVCPEALEAVVVAGDPCADRLAASCPKRGAYRRALGVDDGERLVVAASTWGPASLLGARPDVLARLVAEAHGSRWRVALLAHPNVWFGHGVWQVRSWLEKAVAAGLLVVPVEAEWRGVLIAADAVVSDHGSTCLYAAGLARPVFLTGDGRADVDPAAPMAELMRRAGALPADGAILPTVERVCATWRADQLAGVAARITEFARRMRRCLYELLGLPEPPDPARFDAVAAPTVLDAGVTGEAA